MLHSVRYSKYMVYIILITGCLLGACTTPDTPKPDGPSDGVASDAGDRKEATQELPPQPKTAQLRVMTFNIQCSFCQTDDNDPWKLRLPHLQALIKQHDADLLGIQELFVTAEENNEVKKLIDAHQVYTPIYYIAKEGERLDFPDATIYFRTSRFTLREKGFFWLSPTPDVYFSKGFSPNSTLPRIVAWARLYDKQANRELLFATTHFDNGSPSQEKSAPLSLKRLHALRQGKDTPLIFVGDYNSKPVTTAYKTLVGGTPGTDLKLRDTFDLVPKWEAVTNQTPTPPYDTTDRIDHIFVAGDSFVTKRWIVDLSKYGDKVRYPADHRAIIADLEY